MFPQECREKKVPVCRAVTREECKTVPREKCSQVTTEPDQAPRCSVNTRLVCEDRPRQKCGNKVGHEGRKWVLPVICFLLRSGLHAERFPNRSAQT